MTNPLPIDTPRPPRRSKKTITYDAWLSKMDASVEAECAKIRKKRTIKPARTADGQSLELDLARIRRKRMITIIGDACRFIVIADDLSRSTLPARGGNAEQVRIAIGKLRHASQAMDSALRQMPMSEFLEAER